MHPLNPYLNKKPDFAALAKKHSSFAPFVAVTEAGYASIDFHDPAALRALTTALSKEDWGYDVQLREDRLCPTIANRLDYLYHILDIQPFLPDSSSPANVAAADSGPPVPFTRPLRVVDIGTGHIAIYPLLLHHIRPTAHIVATDAVSFHHSIQTLQANNIPSSAISIRRPTPDQPILFPVFDSLTDGGTKKWKADVLEDVVSTEKEQWDFVICNPPFFGSEEEIRIGREAKVGGVPAAATAADNELITPGGEVEFVGQMIKESLELRDACQWYTSLIGKYSSLASLVEQLKREKVDNYFIKICRQARTTRWILGWSHTAHRLPDSITRPNITPGTAFTKLLPPPNTFSHTPANPSLPIPELRKRIEDVLRDVQLLPPDGGKMAVIGIAPRANTWSRAARRQAARGLAAATGETSVEPLFRVEIRFSDAPAHQSRPSSDRDGIDEEDVAENKGAAVVNDGQGEKADEQTVGSTVELHWLEGRDRTIVEALWKFVLTKAGLISGR